MSTTTTQQTAKRRVLYYLAFLAVFTGIATAATINMNSSPLSGLIIMWSPALAALTASLFVRRSLKEIGWKLTPARWLLVGWGLPILYGFFAYLPLWLTGLGGIPNPTFLERARLTLGMTEGSDQSVIFSAFAFITIVNLLPGMIPSLGEEIGWRGFLVPELSKWIGVKRTALVSGVIWFAWHLPGMLTGGYGTEGTPKVFQILCFAIMVISGSVIFTWLRIKSGNIWAVTILHAVHNNVIQAFFDRITFDTGYTNYFAGEFGLALAIIMSLLAVYFWKQLEEQESAAVEPAMTEALARA